MSIFNKSRSEASDNGRIVKYLKYAVGEIILVVLGILIALYINNRNELRKQQKLQSSVIEEIKKDLASDTTSLNKVIAHYEKVAESLNDVLRGKYNVTYYDTFNAVNYRTCDACKVMIVHYSPFYPHTKGYKRFEALKDLDGSDTTNQALITFYETLVPDMITILDFVKELSIENLKYFEQKPWYTDFINDIYNPEYLEFLSRDQMYKNKVMTYEVLAVANYLTAMKQYKQQAIELIQMIE